MTDGYIKTAAATCNIRVADCEYNRNSIIDAVKSAGSAGVRLLVFPELCVTGCTCADLFFQQTLLDAAKSAVSDIAAATRGIKMLVAVGAPLEKSGKLYNCAVVICDGKIIGAVPKTHLPDYSEFYETRYFAPADDEIGEIEIGGSTVPFGSGLIFKNADMPQMCVGFEICEDLWVSCPPSVSLSAKGATVICNLSASAESVGKAEYRRNLVRMQSAKLLCGYVYADAGDGESTTDAAFSGHNIIAENGVILAETEPFENDMAVSEIDLQYIAHERRRINTFKATGGNNTVLFNIPPEQIRLSRKFEQLPFIPSDSALCEERCREILAIQTAGLKKRIEHTNAKSLVIGLSGGLDSTLALLVSVLAMDKLNRPRTDITAVTMPCFGTTGRTRGNAELLAESLGVSFAEVSIKASVSQHFADIGHDPENHDVTYENSQARERTQVLMDIANKAGGMVIGTGDLSELALGWATYNGDHMSMYGVNASIPKTLIRYIVRYCADTADSDQTKNVLIDILDTPVSPELLPPKDGEIAQKTEDIVGPYELHDFFLYYLVRRGFNPAKIYRIARLAFYGVYSGETILKWLKTFCRRFFAQQFKRSCAPDGVKVGSISFSPRGDFRMPSDAVSALWLAELETL